jgi:hypothetical protein
MGEEDREMSALSDMEIRRRVRAGCRKGQITVMRHEAFEAAYLMSRRFGFTVLPLEQMKCPKLLSYALLNGAAEAGPDTHARSLGFDFVTGGGIPLWVVVSGTPGRDSTQEEMNRMQPSVMRNIARRGAKR